MHKAGIKELGVWEESQMPIHSGIDSSLKYSKGERPGSSPPCKKIPSAQLTTNGSDDHPSVHIDCLRNEGQPGLSGGMAGSSEGEKQCPPLPGVPIFPGAPILGPKFSSGTEISLRGNCGGWGVDPFPHPPSPRAEWEGWWGGSTPAF